MPGKSRIDAPGTLHHIIVRDNMRSNLDLGFVSIHAPVWRATNLKSRFDPLDVHPSRPPSLNKKGAAMATPLVCMAEGPGFEPGLTESESVVLPLDDPPAAKNAENIVKFPKGVKKILV